MARTNSGAVAGILTADYDGTTNLIPFIQSANVIVNRVATLAASRNMTLTAQELELIERWLAAHFYTQSDQVLQQKQTDGAGGTFQGKTADSGICGSKYGQTAIRLDWSGSLEAIDKRKIAKAAFIGSTGDCNVPADTGPGTVPY